MCGRYTLRASPQQMALVFQAEAIGPALLSGWQPRYNIAPTQLAPVVRISGDDKRQMSQLRWGLIPSWATDRSIGSRMINARSETVGSKPAFREALRSRRCLVPADGFYEWQKHGGQKQAMFIHRPDDSPFAFAGLWDRWTDEQNQPLESFTILTTAASEQLRALHDRMPIILQPENFATWLDPAVNEPTAIEPLLADVPQDLVLQPVGTHVNNVGNDDPRCIVASQAQRTLW
jgi:putative SOS response-associated peptidase YedK